MKKKFFALFVAALLCAAMTVSAAFADYEIADENNLAVNPFNWHMPTVSNAELTVGESGIRFENFTKDQNAATVYTGGRTGEFCLQMYVDAHLNVPAEGMAEWRYSNLYVTFLIDRDPADCVAETAVPWYANKVYMSLGVGLDANGTPKCSFLKYNAFANNCSRYDYVGTPSSINIADGQKHWIEIISENFDEADGTGRTFTALIDGEQAAYYKYYDDLYSDPDTRQEYEVEISSVTGSIGLYATSDWPAGMSASRMDNYIVVEKLQIISYDRSAEGEYLPQMSEPAFEIEAKDYVTQAKYDLGDPIEIRLGDLFSYEGTREIAYEITLDETGEAIGAIANGYWSWTPEQAGNYDVTFRASVAEGNSAVNYLTLRVADGGGSGTTNPEPGDEPGGCNSSVGASGAIGLLVSAAGIALLKKKRS